MYYLLSCYVSVLVLEAGSLLPLTNMICLFLLRSSFSLIRKGNGLQLQVAVLGSFTFFFFKLALMMSCFIKHSFRAFTFILLIMSLAAENLY